MGALSFSPWKHSLKRPLVREKYNGLVSNLERMSSLLARSASCCKRNKNYNYRKKGCGSVPETQLKKVYCISGWSAYQNQWAQQEYNLTVIFLSSLHTWISVKQKIFGLQRLYFPVCAFRCLLMREAMDRLQFFFSYFQHLLVIVFSQTFIPAIHQYCGKQGKWKDNFFVESIIAKFVFFSNWDLSSLPWKEYFCKTFFFLKSVIFGFLNDTSKINFNLCWTFFDLFKTLWNFATVKFYNIIYLVKTVSKV